MQEELGTYLDDEDIEEFFMEMGAYQTEQALERYKERYNWGEMSKRKILDYGFNVLKTLGWGNIDIDSLSTGEGGEFKIEVTSPTFPSIYQEMRGDASEPVCHYLRGMLKKSMQAIVFDTDVEIRETQCAAVDGDRCIFEGCSTG